MTIDFAGRLGERYDVGPLLGHGGMAEVYRATDRVLGREVAIKVLRSSAGPAERDRFLDEGRILANLNHPGLVTLLDVGVDGERPFLVMELVEGRTLAGLIGDPMDPADVQRIGTELAEALAFAHASNVVHRDVKPGNVLLREDGRVALFDFGIARLAGELHHHTAPGESVGTAAYLAPEQVEGSEVGTPADVYSLGLLLLELLKGSREYPGPALEAAVARLRREPEIPASLDARWQRLLRQMTAREPLVRPPAAQVATTLRSWGSAAVEPDQTMIGLPALPALPAQPRITMRRVLIVLAIAAMLAVITSGIVLAGRTPESPAESPAAAPQVAASLQPLLDDLHATVAPLGAPGADRLLNRVDRALVERQYPAAALALRSLIDRLTALDATAAVGSAKALLSALPERPTTAPPVKEKPPAPAVKKSHGGGGGHSDKGPAKSDKGPGHGKGKGKH